MALTPDEKKIIRYRFPHALYEETGGDEQAIVNMLDIGNKIGVDQEITRVTFDYLRNEGLIEAIAFGGIIKISHLGVKEYEDSVSHPDAPTTHFLPVNIVNNVISVQGNISGSQVQQSSPNVRIQVQNALDLDQVGKWVSEMSAQIGTLELEATKRTSVLEEIETIKALLATSKPNSGFIRTALGTIKTVLENVAGNVIAALILSMPK